MLDLNDFVTERGGNPNKIKESQRKRSAPEEVVDEVIALYEEARKGVFEPPENKKTASNFMNSTLCCDSNLFRAQCSYESDWYEKEGI